MDEAAQAFFGHIPHGFRVTHLACVPCGERLDAKTAGAEAIVDFTREHGEHVTAFLETHTFRRPTWRRS